MGRQKKPYLEQIAIEATAAEGNGLAHVDGKVLFVKGGIPGDIVDVQVNKVRSGYSPNRGHELHPPGWTGPGFPNCHAVHDNRTVRRQNRNRRLDSRFS